MFMYKDIIIASKDGTMIRADTLFMLAVVVMNEIIAVTKSGWYVMRMYIVHKHLSQA